MTDRVPDEDVIEALVIGGLIAGMTDQMVPIDEARRRAVSIYEAAKHHIGPTTGIVGRTAEWRWHLVGGLAELERRGWTVTPPHR